MAKDKERAVNPAQQQRKADKAKALKKSRAELQARRNEKLAQRNPAKIQRQIDDLKALEASGDIKPREKAILADLERDLKSVQKARETLGDKAPHSTRPRDRSDFSHSSLGKRRHDGQRKYERNQNSGSDTDESVRNIPWPRDTPPPVPQEFRRNRQPTSSQPAAVAPVEAKTTYESAPQIRDLKKEAVNRFVPNVVKRKQEAVRGQAGQLLEPDELDRLEQEGYIRTDHDRPKDETNELKFSQYNPKQSDHLQKLKAEEEAFEKELAMQDDSDGGDTAQVTQPQQAASKLAVTRHVEIEEVEDEDR